MQRCIEWTRRYGTGAPGGLGFGAELWADVSSVACSRTCETTAILRWPTRSSTSATGSIENQVFSSTPGPEIVAADVELHRSLYDD
jgi:hypothetical protein